MDLAWYWPLAALAVAIFGLLFGQLLKGIDRVLVARMQSRVGPPLVQPLLDIKKLLTKETIIPASAIPWLFSAMPMLALLVTLTVLFYLPIAGFDPVLSGSGDLILIIYLLAVPGVALVIGGFASGSPYGSVGAQREMVMMIAYELPLAVTIVALAWLHGSFELTAMVAEPAWEQVGVLGAAGLVLLLISMLYITPAELSKVPFDAPEAETEIAGGLLAEYSGRNMALFYLSDGVKTLAVTGLIVVLFFPWTLTDLLPLLDDMGEIASGALNVLFFMLKVILVTFVSTTLIRSVYARLRIEQAVQQYWFSLTSVALMGLVLLMADPAL